MAIRDIFLITCLITLNLLAASAWSTLADMKRKLEDIDEKLGDVRSEVHSSNFWHGGSDRDSNAAEG
jgi:hypothetical protein